MYVSTMLMLLVLLTYGRLESFRGFGYIQAGFKSYMEKHERDYINKEAIDLYESTTATSQNPSNDDEEKSQSKSQARAKLMFNLFIDKQERDKQNQQNSKVFEQLSQMTEKLIYYLYSDQPFFQKIEDKRPNFIAEILQALMRSTDGLTEKNKIKKTCDIAQIDLGDFELNDVFTKMLRGSTNLPIKIPVSDNIEIVFEQGQSFVRPNFLPTEGYYSLLDFVTLDHGNYKIRVFLASPQLLMAIYGNPTTVYDILQGRYELYKNVKNGGLPDEATNAFKNQFSNQVLPYILPDTLDFGVSKVNPKDYE